MMVRKLFIWGMILVLIGGMICFFAVRRLGFDLRKISGTDFEEKVYDVDRSFSSISADVTIDNVRFRMSGDGKCRVVCEEAGKLSHEVSVNGDTLTIKSVENKEGILEMELFTSSPVMTVYLTEREYRMLSVQTDTGDIDIPSDFTFDSISINGSTADVSVLSPVKGALDVRLSTGDVNIMNITSGSVSIRTTTGKIDATGLKTAGNVKVEVDTGKISLRDVACAGLVSDGTTGDITLENVIATGSFSIVRDTGDVRFAASDAAEIYVKTSTGKVTGTLLTDKIFLTETHTGKIDVPKSVTGGRCEISTDTGDIKISIG